jgi:hypothetical protein
MSRHSNEWTAWKNSPDILLAKGWKLRERRGRKREKGEEMKERELTGWEG